MKKLLLLMTMVIATLGVSAQSTKVVTGAVIDKYGNPLPNALVEATGGAESVTTEADGTFRIEVPIWLKSLTAKYAGLSDKKINLSGNAPVIFEMKKGWRPTWFVNLTSSVNFGSDTNAYGTLGLMGGFLGNWGAYAKVLWQMGDIDNDGVPSITAGVIKQVADPWYLYLGAGFSRTYFEYTSSVYYGYYPYGIWGTRTYQERSDGGMIDIGAIYRYRNFDINLGYSISIGDGYSNTCTNSAIQLGVGYCF